MRTSPWGSSFGTGRRGRHRSGHPEAAGCFAQVDSLFRKPGKSGLGVVRGSRITGACCRLRFWRR